MMENNSNKKRGFSVVRLVLLLVSLSVFVYAGFNLINIHLEYRAIDRLNSEVQNTYVTLNPQSNNFVIDWDALIARNDNVVAWIYVPGTNINFPVLQGANNDSYLRRNIDRQHSQAGSIFVDSSNSASFTDLSTMIHGHNMRNDTKFSQIADLANGIMTDIPTHVHIYLPDNTLKLYKITSINRITTSSNLFRRANNHIEDYFTLMSEGTVASFDFDRDSASRVLMLSTCGNFATNTPIRAVVYAVFEEQIFL